MLIHWRRGRGWKTRCRVTVRRSTEKAERAEKHSEASFSCAADLQLWPHHWGRGHPRLPLCRLPRLCGPEPAYCTPQINPVPAVRNRAAGSCVPHKNQAVSLKKGLFTIKFRNMFHQYSQSQYSQEKKQTGESWYLAFTYFHEIALAGPVFGSGAEVQCVPARSTHTPKLNTVQRLLELRKPLLGDYWNTSANYSHKAVLTMCSVWGLKCWLGSIKIMRNPTAPELVHYHKLAIINQIKKTTQHACGSKTWASTFSAAVSHVSNPRRNSFSKPIKQHFPPSH